MKYVEQIAKKYFHRRKRQLNGIAVEFISRVPGFKSKPVRQFEISKGARLLSFNLASSAILFVNKKTKQLIDLICVAGSDSPNQMRNQDGGKTSEDLKFVCNSYCV